MAYERSIKRTRDILPCDLVVPHIFFAHRFQAIVANHDTSSRLERGNQCLQHLDTVLVALVMADPAEEVYSCVFNRLLGVEVMCLKLDALLEFCRYLGCAIFHHFWHILHHEVQLGILLCQGDTDKTE